MHRYSSFAGKAALLTFSSALSILGAEIGLRLVDDYKIFSLPLVSLASAPPLPSQGDKVYAKKVPLAEGVDESWYLVDPPATNVSPNDIETIRKVDPELARIHDQTPPPMTVQSAYEWNINWVKKFFCAKYPSELLSPDIFVFDPGNGSVFPRYRLARDVVMPLNGATINAFGFRGSEISLNKPPKTIRVAFLGASTTLDFLGERNAYPDFVGNWLNLWARAEGFNVKFETINGGRYGFGANDIVAMFHDEVLPLEPDLVIYYEGVNNLDASTLIKWPQGQRPTPPKITFRQKSPLENYSDLIKRLLRIWDQFSWASGREIKKPTLTVIEPSVMRLPDPDPYSDELPAYLRPIVSSLDQIRLDAQALNATFTVVPFVFLVSDGLQLDPDRNYYVFRYLNETLYPYSYAFLRRQVDFENLIFKQYDRKYDQPIIELDRLFPQDPDLFVDPVHMHLYGSRLKAWIIFNGVVKILRSKIIHGELPRPMQHAIDTHPAFPNGTKRTLWRAADIQKACDAGK